jgi:alpha-glucosidase
MARQAADDVWLVGAATNESPRQLEIPLDFLPPGNYEVTVIEDGKNAHYLNNRETLKSKTEITNPSGKVKVKLAAGGGACLIIKEIGKRM